MWPTGCVDMMEPSMLVDAPEPMLEAFCLPNRECRHWQRRGGAQLLLFLRLQNVCGAASNKKKQTNWNIGIQFQWLQASFERS
mmetsp:Transcript_15168/g.35643  ORF Transcript_15168/g.35643 Transcript_15168/m.35643 type:complete len:83 (-) Transcript_15168:32-280(-)